MPNLSATLTGAETPRRVPAATDAIRAAAGPPLGWAVPTLSPRG